MDRIKPTRGETSPTSTKEVSNNRMGDVVTDKLSKASNKPLVRSDSEVVSEETFVQDVIKPVEKVVKTAKPITDNVLVDDIDKTTVSDLTDILSSQIVLVNNTPTAISGVELSDTDRARLLKEEDKRRELEDLRTKQINDAYDEELSRRTLFDTEISNMKLEFDIYLKRVYPEFVGDRNMTTSEIQQKQSDAQKVSDSIRLEKEKLQKSKIKRLEDEKRRKYEESQLQINILTEQEVQTFFEEEIITEQKVKLAENPELDGLNEVERTIKEVSEMELKLGRKIVPYRDIVESEESDFDVNSYTTSNDILIKTDNSGDIVKDMDKIRQLEELRLSLGVIDGEDFIY